MHNFVDTGWRKLGAFLLRALRVYIRGIRTVDQVSKSTPNHVIPSFFFFSSKFQSISQHIIKYFVHGYMKFNVHEIMVKTCENLNFY